MKISVYRWLAVVVLGSLGATSFAEEEKTETKDPQKGGGAKSAPVGPPNTQRTLYDSIIRIEAAGLMPDYENPWNAGREVAGSGTGFRIGKNQFLTNAHVVSNATNIVVKKYSDPEKYAAKIKHIAHDCDLALLELEDDSAFEDVRKLPIGDVPGLESTVTVIGYPVGGNRLSITRGVVSRIDFQPYSHSGADLHLTIQIDAAINPGNSGGPVMQDGKVVGVAFQGFSGAVAQNVGYMIPTPVIKRFLKDIEDGKYDRYVDMAIGDFELINPAQRKALGLPNNRVGSLVTSVSDLGSCDGKLEEGDVILEIDGHEVASNGSVEINGEFVAMTEIAERKFKGDKVNLKILRNKEEKMVEVELKPFQAYLIQCNTYDVRPRYVVFAGLVFQPLDRNLMAALNIQDLETRFLFNTYVQDEVYMELPEIVVLTNLLADEINTNFRPYRGSVVEKINGKEIKRLQDAYDALHPTDLPEFFVIQCKGEGLPLVIEASRLAKAEERIMKTYQIEADSFLGEAPPPVFTPGDLN